MSPRYSAAPINILAGGQSFVFTPKALIGFPEAAAFLDGQLTRGVAAHTAKLYATHVARLRRQGRLHALDLISDVTARTAANAYHRWQRDYYDVRVRTVHRAFVPMYNLQKSIPWLRCGSLVPPLPGKTVPQLPVPSAGVALPAPGEAMPALRGIEWVACDTWTLHVPEHAVGAHTDPCATCTVIVPTPEQLEVIATAFEQAWGHRNIYDMPPSALLFGEPPIENTVERIAPAHTRVVALSETNTTTEALAGAKARVVRDVDDFLAQMRGGVDGVYLSFAACGDRLSEVFREIEKARAAP